MHSLLGLAAGHLVRKQDAISLIPAAHFHRSKAMQGVNDLVASQTRSAEEDDALIAACYALAFQVACIGDRPEALWITIRTISVVNAEIWQKCNNSIFGRATAPDKHNAHMYDKLKDYPPLNKAMINEAQGSLANIKPLCSTVLERRLLGLVEDICEELLKSSVDGYLAFTLVYAFVALMPSVCSRSRSTRVVLSWSCGG